MITQTVPLEEIGEMLSILKSIQRHQREIYLLTQRSKAMCPQILDTKFYNPLYEFLDYTISLSFHNHQYLVRKFIENLETRREEMSNNDQ